MVVPPVERVHARVLRVPLPSPTLPPATTTNAWVLGNDELIVVDPGSPWPDAQAALLAALDGRRVRAVFLTHHHIDHMSGARALAAATGAPILCHPATAAALDWQDTIAVHDGDVLTTGADRWQALHTPGHARGHLCLLHAQLKIVVAGDMVAGEGTILLAPPDADLGAFRAGLARLAACGAETALPAHGPALPAPAVFVENLRHRDARTDACRAALRDGPQSAEELVPAVYGALPEAVVPLAALQLCAHLAWLAERGEAIERAGRWQLPG